MFELSVPSIGELPYELYIPITNELNLLKARHTSIYKTYWEMMCYFRICTNVSRIRSQGIGQKVWDNYLFWNLNHNPASIARYDVTGKRDIQMKIDASRDVAYMTKYEEDGFKAGSIFKSFHY